MNAPIRIFVCGHNGMVGSSIVRNLKSIDGNIIITKERKELDLSNQLIVDEFFRNEKIDQVYLAAAKVGGIYANNKYPAEFIYQNLMIQNNVINSAYTSGVKKLLFLGSSCIYPREIEQPIKESDLLTSKLEPTNEPYAIAKIAGIKLCESYNRQYKKKYGISYRSIMPTNLYGPGDTYDDKNSHVIPALIQRFHLAKINNSQKVNIWGSGKPKREFLHVNDMASASIFIMNLSDDIYDSITTPMLSHINVGSGEDISIANLARMISRVVGYNGEIIYDKSKPDGTMRKLMDNSKITSLGWKKQIELEEGLQDTYKDFLQGIK